ncbi:hypothetical protein [Paraglaciecola aestuariivivens]
MKVSILFLVLLLSGCSIVAPTYQVSIDNIQQIKQSKIEPVAVNEISSQKSLNSISLRGTQLKSNTGTFGTYITNAIIEELKLAKAYNPLSNKIITGELVANDIDVAGFSTGTGVVAVKFVVTQDNVEIFQKTIQAENKFDSSFMGAVAIPNAQNSYSDLIQTLLNKLFSDPEFLSAVSTK